MNTVFIKSLFYVLIFSVLILPQRKLNYPVTKKVNVVDNYFGVKVADPYRWLEDDNSEETKQWVRKQNELTFSYLRQIPYRDKIKKRFEEIFNYPKYSAPFKGGNYYFYFKNDGLQNQSVLYIQKDLESEAEIFLDPNEFSSDGTVSLSTYSVSNDGKFFAYGTASGGSDWNEYHVMEVENKNKLSDNLKWIKFSGIAWFKDGFFYSRYPEPKEGEELSATNENCKVYYHKVGTSQEEDVLIYEDPSHPKRFFSAQTTEDEKYLIIYFSEGTSKNGMLVKDLSNPNSVFNTVVEKLEDNYRVIDNLFDKLLVLTDRKAPKYRLVLIDPQNPDEEKWEAVIPESEHVLTSVSLIGGKIIANYMQDARNRVYVFDYLGNLESELELPTIGTVGTFSGKKDNNIAFYTFTSFTYPPTIYMYDASSNQSTLFRQPEIKFDLSNYETKQVFYKSKDGTSVPMFIVHRKGLVLDGKNPAYLYGYGGFNVSLNPTFSASRLIFLENGGVFAMANTRGGGEYGKEWHLAGTVLNKQNVFDDFIAAAEYLIKEKFTNPSKLAIAGASNGGLLVGAVMNQRPDLFKVALPAVGVMDMLRFHKFTIGWAWVVDYGSSDDSVQFNYLYKYSPLHNIKKGVKYPATLVTTADHDDRVVPAHSFKYIATLQEKQKGNNPVLIRIETRAGHGAGKPTSKIIEEVADVWSFVFYNLGVSPIY